MEKGQLTHTHTHTHGDTVVFVVVATDSGKWIGAYGNHADPQNRFCYIETAMCYCCVMSLSRHRML